MTDRYIPIFILTIAALVAPLVVYTFFKPQPAVTPADALAYQVAQKISCAPGTRPALNCPMPDELLIAPPKPPKTRNPRDWKRYQEEKEQYLQLARRYRAKMKQLANQCTWECEPVAIPSVSIPQPAPSQYPLPSGYPIPTDYPVPSNYPVPSGVQPVPTLGNDLPKVCPEIACPLYCGTKQGPNGCPICDCDDKLVVDE